MHVGKQYPYFFPPDASQPGRVLAIDLLPRRLSILFVSPQGSAIADWVGTFFSEVGVFDRGAKQVRYKCMNPPAADPDDLFEAVFQIRPSDPFPRWHHEFTSGAGGPTYVSTESFFSANQGRSASTLPWIGNPQPPPFQGWVSCQGDSISWANMAIVEPDYHPYRHSP